MGAKTHCSKILFLIFTIIFCGSVLFCAITNVTAGEKSGQDFLVAADEPPFVVTTRNNLISVKAKDAPLLDVVETIGRELGIAVFSHISKNEKVTAEFQDLPLEAAIKRLSGNYVFTSNKKGEQVSSIYLVPKGHQESLGASGKGNLNRQEMERSKDNPGPFKFELDPSRDAGDSSNEKGADILISRK
jgi:type II secretory pathway component GspD/PulD (secretin)